MILNLLRRDNRWLIRESRKGPARGSIVQEPARNWISVRLDGDECLLRVRRSAGSDIYTLYHDDSVLRGALRRSSSGSIHWRDSAGLRYTTKAAGQRARLLAHEAAAVENRTAIAQLFLHPRGPRVAFEASERAKGEHLPLLVLGLFAPLLVVLPVSETGEPDAKPEEE